MCLYGVLLAMAVDYNEWKYDKKLHPMADLIHASDTLLFGDLENLQNDVVAADINGSKCGILHIRFSSFFFKGYPKKPAPNTKRTF